MIKFVSFSFMLMMLLSSCGMNIEGENGAGSDGSFKSYGDSLFSVTAIDEIKIGDPISKIGNALYSAKSGEDISYSISGDPRVKINKNGEITLSVSSSELTPQSRLSITINVLDKNGEIIRSQAIQVRVIGDVQGCEKRVAASATEAKANVLSLLTSKVSSNIVEGFLTALRTGNEMRPAAPDMIDAANSLGDDSQSAMTSFFNELILGGSNVGLGEYLYSFSLSGLCSHLSSHYGIDDVACQDFVNGYSAEIRYNNDLSRLAFSVNNKIIYELRVVNGVRDTCALRSVINLKPLAELAASKMNDMGEDPSIVTNMQIQGKIAAFFDVKPDKSDVYADLGIIEEDISAKPNNIVKSVFLKQGITLLSHNALNAAGKKNVKVAAAIGNLSAIVHEESSSSSMLCEAATTAGDGSSAPVSSCASVTTFTPRDLSLYVDKHLKIDALITDDLSTPFKLSAYLEGGFLARAYKDSDLYAKLSTDTSIAKHGLFAEATQLPLHDSDDITGFIHHELKTLGFKGQLNIYDAQNPEIKVNVEPAIVKSERILLGTFDRVLFTNVLADSGKGRIDYKATVPDQLIWFFDYKASQGTADQVGLGGGSLFKNLDVSTNGFSWLNKQGTRWEDSVISGAAHLTIESQDDNGNNLEEGINFHLIHSAFDQKYTDSEYGYNHETHYRNLDGGFAHFNRDYNATDYQSYQGINVSADSYSRVEVNQMNSTNLAATNFILTGDTESNYPWIGAAEETRNGVINLKADSFNVGSLIGANQHDLKSVGAVDGQLQFNVSHPSDSYSYTIHPNSNFVLEDKVNGVATQTPYSAGVDASQSGVYSDYQNYISSLLFYSYVIY